ncbi:MAG: dihydroorotate dehydrogenase electron transfer subunit [Oscillospiraceae bacterium]|jgi:dihydroorotate dehydrogenase electron transfer subunit|nr:dihydroorotate dehydrogenase electron transfer subunit [Oscillospiraceae bacterium]
MKQKIYKVTENTKIAKNTFKMVISGDTSEITKPGQFINIKINNLFLRRPISVCDYDEKNITIIYKVVGKGTGEMSNLKSGDSLDILTGLGNGYDTSKSGANPLLIGGGGGIPPLYNLCKTLISCGKDLQVVLGFNTKEEVFYEKEFKSLGAKVCICTADGSYGEKGFTADIIKNLNYTYFYTCGPMSMFKAIENVAKTSGQYSFEERMGCGFGACMGCSCKTKYGNKRICKEGPVLEREEIIW